MKPTIENMKSCANCIFISIVGIDCEIGKGKLLEKFDYECLSCQNYNQWQFDNLTAEERNKQEVG